MTNFMSRFQRQESVMLAPGCCFFCRNNVGPYINTGATLPMEGTICVCQTCLVEMYNQLELSVPESQDPEVAYRKGVDDTKEKINELVTAAVGNLLVPVISAGVADALEDDATLSQGAGDASGSEPGTESSSLESLSVISLGGRDDVPIDSSNGKSTIKSK